MHTKGQTQFDTVFHPANARSMGGIPTHTVEAWAPEHAASQWAQAHPSERGTYAGSSIDPGIRPIASLSWHHKTGEIRGVYTEKEHQRQGIATALHSEAGQIAESTRGVPKPKHSADRTTAGDAWAKAVGGTLPRRGRTN
jgi:GNAT superfamily N-acetyltransferase